MTARRLSGTAILFVLGSISVALDLVAYMNEKISGKTLLLYLGIAVFGLYTFGAIFFDYAVSFRTTIEPSAPWGMRLFQAAVGLFIWGVTVWGVLNRW